MLLKLLIGLVTYLLQIVIIAQAQSSINRKWAWPWRILFWLQKWVERGNMLFIVLSILCCVVEFVPGMLFSVCLGTIV